MRKPIYRAFSVVLLLAMMLSVLAVGASAAPASSWIITTPTGYTSADQVEYKTFQQNDRGDGKTYTVIANWGARGEPSTFLSTYAQEFYTESYDELLTYAGGTDTASAPNSPLFKHLQEMMASAQTHYTYYTESQNVRDYYRYTDCVSNDITQVALLYRGGLVTGDWNSGKIWNQEHCWPRSKLHSSDADIKAQMIGDIAHLRPTNPSENGGRSNDCYGEKKGSEYYNPGISVHGDVARMMLYMYVRWGAVDTMWGAGGVMESLDILLKWMEEDPVDTWEMGRNDSVQSITGTRNVFIDYPELAFVLFGQEVPKTMPTPSGEGSDGTAVPVPPVEQPPVDDSGDPIEKPTTPAEILDALYKLEDRETLAGGPYTLTGKIIQINTPYSEEKQNIILTIEVEGHADKPVYCYRLMGEAAASVKVGDTITVKGELYRYKDTFEFNSGCTIEAHIPASGTPDVPVDPKPTEPAPTDPVAPPAADGEHQIVKVPAKAPTAQEGGWIAHYQCEKCGKLYTDEHGQAEVSQSFVTLAKLQPQQEGPNVVVIVCIVLGVLAAGAVVAVVVIKKK